MPQHVRIVPENDIRRAAVSYSCSWGAWDRAISLFQRFRSNEEGNIIILGAIILPVAAGCVAAAVAYSNANNSRSSMQAALDSAVLAGVIASSTASEQITAAQNYFPNNV